ncbi:hypothetical protein C8F01DRAFT_1364265 [Mycena amicta]|nr:hypothetical protein C8F01DRAFT_1364265 [Mycena amicta]
MAKSVLSPKCADLWTTRELAALNISVETVDALSFFGRPLPDPSSDPTLLAHPVLMSNETSSAGPISKDERRFFGYLHVATENPSAVVDFCAHLLQTLDYDEPDRTVRRYVELRFLMGGQWVHAKPDVAIKDAEQHYMLLVQQDKRCLSAEIEPQLIAEAIAAHYVNNERRRLLMLPPLATEVFAGIIMTGSAPIFYKIPVSEALLEAVETTQYPAHATVVSRFVPPVRDLITYLEYGMVPLANRQLILQCFGAFRQWRHAPRRFANASASFNS